jgi:hypothetical protein
MLNLPVVSQRVDIVVGCHTLRVAEESGDLGERAAALVVQRPPAAA